MQAALASFVKSVEQNNDQTKTNEENESHEAQIIKRLLKLFS